MASSSSVSVARSVSETCRVGRKRSPAGEIWLVSSYVCVSVCLSVCMNVCSVVWLTSVLFFVSCDNELHVRRKSCIPLACWAYACSGSLPLDLYMFNYCIILLFMLWRIKFSIFLSLSLYRVQTKLTTRITSCSMWMMLLTIVIAARVFASACLYATRCHARTIWNLMWHFLDILPLPLPLKYRRRNI